MIAVHVAPDAVHPPLAGVLPRPDLASVVEFGAVFSQPERIGGQAICLELGGDKVGGAIQADLAASPFDRLQKLQHDVRPCLVAQGQDGFFILLVKKDGQLEALAFQHFQTGSCLLLTALHAVGVAVPVGANLDTSSFRSGVIALKLLVLLAQLPTVARPDDSKLHAILGHLCPVNHALVLGYVDSL